MKKQLILIAGVLLLVGLFIFLWIRTPSTKQLRLVVPAEKVPDI